jgi:hypothetical protein
VVELLVKQEANLEARDRLDATLLLLAMPQSEKAALRLISLGADVTAVDSDGDTVLHRVPLSGEKTILELLLQKGTETQVTARNDEGETPYTARRVLQLKHWSCYSRMEQTLTPYPMAGSEPSILLCPMEKNPRP